MNSDLVTEREGPPPARHVPVGGVLEELPQGLYAAAHVLFLVAGIWLGAKAYGESLPFAGALTLYVLSQAGFLAYFGRAITMKLAVLTEQMLVFAMVAVIVIQAS